MSQTFTLASTKRIKGNFKTLVKLMTQLISSTVQAPVSMVVSRPSRSLTVRRELKDIVQLETVLWLEGIKKGKILDWTVSTPLKLSMDYIVLNRRSSGSTPTQYGIPHIQLFIPVYEGHSPYMIQVISSLSFLLFSV